MSDDDNDGQMIFGDLGGLKLPDICLAGEEKPRKNLNQETCTDRGSNPGPLRDRRTCCRLAHSGGLQISYCSFNLYRVFGNSYYKFLEDLGPQGPRISFGHHYHYHSSFMTDANDMRC